MPTAASAARSVPPSTTGRVKRGGHLTAAGSISRCWSAGNVRLYRLPAAGGQPEVIVGDRGAAGNWSVAKDGSVAYAFASPGDLAQLYLKRPGQPPRKLTDLNAEVLAGKSIADVESFNFISNDNTYEIEAFLTKPMGMTAGSRHPLIVNIHGGPHAQQGPAFQIGRAHV